MFLTVFKGISPNTGRNPYLLYSSIDNFMTALSEESAGTYATEQYSYRAETGVFRLKWDGDAANAMNVSYACVTDNQTGATYLRAYHVANVTFISGYLEIRTTLDLWGTFYAQSQISNITVTRSNMNIGDGVFDDIDVTTVKNFTAVASTNLKNVSDLAIVYVVLLGLGTSSILVNGSATAIKVFANELSELATPSIDYAIELVSGIYGAEATIGDLPAAVLKAYLVPKATLGIRDTSVPIFKVKVAGSDVTNLTPEYEVAPFTFTAAFPVDISANYKYFFGTKLNGLELVRETVQTTVYMDFIVKQDGMQVIARQGDNQRDLTDQFEVGLTSNDGNYTATQKIAGILSIIGSTAAGAFQIAAGGSGLVTGTLQTASGVTGLIRQGKPAYSPGGDGVNTFRLLSGTTNTAPLGVQTFQSKDDEEERAARFGASFFEYVASLETVANATALFPSYNIPAYVQAVATVSGVNEEARAAIANAIASGIYVKAV